MSSVRPVKLATPLVNGTINVTVNHAPVGTSNTVSTTKSTAYTFAVADFGFTDPGDTPPNHLKAVEIRTLPGNGTLTDNGVAVTALQSVPVGDITGNNLVYMPKAGDTGVPYTSFAFQVQDDGGTDGGGVDLDPSPKTMAINVTAMSANPASSASQLAPGGTGQQQSSNQLVDQALASEDYWT